MISETMSAYFDSLVQFGIAVGQAGYSWKDIEEAPEDFEPWPEVAEALAKVEGFVETEPEIMALYAD